MLVLPNLSPFAKIFYKWLQAAAPAKAPIKLQTNHTITYAGRGSSCRRVPMTGLSMVQIIPSSKLLVTPALLYEV
jgi:hypothetical protein